VSPQRVVVADHRPLVCEMIGRRLVRAGLEVVSLDAADVAFDVVLVGRPAARQVVPSGGDRRIVHFTDETSIDTLAEAILRLHDLEPGPSIAATPDGIRLTPREQEVLDAVAAGLRAEQVGARLGITRASVQNHKQRIFGKLGVHSQAEAVSVTRRAGPLGRTAPGDRG
jgi:DNA-binding CsgD family transcriptional regulator